MARAARAIAVQARAMLGFGYGARVLLLVGSGDNGADALYAGTELARRGVAVDAVAADPARVDVPALAAFRRAGGRLIPLAAAGDTDLIIDGLLGIGASGPLREAYLPLVRHALHSPAPVLAVDLPSGVDPDTGAVAGDVAISADVTVCMGALKPGLLVGDGRLRAGRVLVVDLGLSAELPEPLIRRLEAGEVAAALRQPGPDDDKYTRGVVGVAAGSQAYPGAAQLCVGSSRVQAWVVGPGLGDTDDAVESLRGVLASDVPVVIDADGLNLLVDRRELLSDRRADTVLTPHDREFERLFGPVGTDRIAAARRAAAESGAVVLLKGYATVIAAPDGRCYLNPTGTPALATAGSGDVLAGLTGSLLASGIEAALAAAVAAYLHGAAGARAAKDGPVVASDLLPALRAEIGMLTA